MKRIFTILLALSVSGFARSARCSDSDEGISAAILETVTEQVQRTAEGKLRQTITTTERVISDREKVVETKRADKNGDLKTVVRQVERWDAAGNYLKSVERLRDGSMVTTYVYTESVDAEGGRVVSEKSRDKDGLLVLTKRITTGGNDKFSYRVVELRNAAGELVVASRTETVLSKDSEGNDVRTFSQKDSEGDMVPVRRVTQVKNEGGAQMTIVEVKDKHDNWVIIDEKSTVLTHVTAK